ncbi:MAG: ABC transporter permease subunit [Pseudonocardiaceae bacterium]|nr:ABC transporter permease subunit [Pseudonocardiaceae bacterium]
MGNLIKAEFRKVLTTKLWWALLIPTVLLALGWSLATGAIGTELTNALESSEARTLQRALGVNSDEWLVSVFGMARSINIAMLFPLIFGGLAISNEVSRKTITTTFLTAPTRVAALTAKMINYVVWGAIYGVAIVATVSLGIVITSDSDRLPAAGGWLGLAGVGILMSILMTLFGIGIGALIRSVPGTVVTLLLYFLLLENALQLGLAGQLPEIGGFLPNGSANGMTGSVATDIFLGAAGVVPDEIEFTVRSIAGALGAFDWWLSGLIFLGWTLVAFGGGWWSTQQRDVT